jgi:hypothetical protein
MRSWWFPIMLAACAADAPEPRPSSPATAAVDPKLDQLVASHSLIVRGRGHIEHTRSGHIGTIEVLTIYKGACPPSILFVSAPVTSLGVDSIFFLDPEPTGQWHVATIGPDSVSLPVSAEARVIAAIHVAAPPVASRDPRPASSTAEGGAVAIDPAQPDLAAFRAGAGQAWSPDRTPAAAAAERVFDHIAWTGATEQTVLAALGKPDDVLPDGRWRYVRHTGEAGVIRLLRMAGGRVTAVDIVRTQ